MISSATKFVSTRRGLQQGGIFYFILVCVRGISVILSVLSSAGCGHVVLQRLMVAFFLDPAGLSLDGKAKDWPRLVACIPVTLLVHFDLAE